MSQFHILVYQLGQHINNTRKTANDLFKTTEDLKKVIDTIDDKDLSFELTVCYTKLLVSVNELNTVADNTEKELHKLLWWF